MSLCENIDAENKVLCSILVDNTALRYAAGVLRPEMFSRDVNRAIYKIILDMFNDGRDIHPTVVIEECKKKELFHTEADAQKYILSIVEWDAVAWCIKEYCAAVIEAWQRKKIVIACNAASELARNNPDDNGISVLSKLMDNLRCNTNLPIHINDLFPDFYRMLEKRFSSTRFRTGIEALDNCFPIWGEGALVVVKGRRGSGKTHLGVHLTKKAIDSGLGVVWYTFEMPTTRLLERILACWSGIRSSMFLSKTEDVFSHAAYCISLVSDTPLWICDKRRHARQMMAEVPLLEYKGIKPGVIIIDYMELVPAAHPRETRELELADTISTLGELAIQQDTTCVVLSQVNKLGTERGSESVGNRADLVVELAKDTFDNVRTLRIEKNRYGIETKIDVTCDLNYSYFSDREEV